MFRPRRPSSAVYKTERDFQSVVNRYCYVIAHNQFGYIEECSNEPLWHFLSSSLPACLSFITAMYDPSTKSCMQLMIMYVLTIINLRGWNVLDQLLLILLYMYLITTSSPDIDNVAMSLHDIICHKCTNYYKVVGSVFLRFYVTKNSLRPKAARGPLMACHNWPPLWLLVQVMPHTKEWTKCFQ